MGKHYSVLELPDGKLIISGTGAPESLVIAPPGSLYLRDTGQVYRKATGTGNTGWVEMVNGSGGSVSYYSHITLVTNVGVTAWTNMPAAATEFGSNIRTRLKAMLTNAVEARLHVAVSTAGASTAILYIQFSPDGTTWTDLGISVQVATVGDRFSAFVAVPTAAKGDVFLRIMGSGGDGAIDPIFGTISVAVRYSVPVA